VAEYVKPVDRAVFEGSHALFEALVGELARGDSCGVGGRAHDAVERADAAAVARSSGSAGAA
jgi:hypothetical protein